MPPSVLTGPRRPNQLPLSVGEVEFSMWYVLLFVLGISMFTYSFALALVDRRRALWAIFGLLGAVVAAASIWMAQTKGIMTYHG